MPFIQSLTKAQDSYPKLPGPKVLPYIGVAPQFLSQGVSFLYKQHLKYGDFSRFPIPGVRGVLVTDPEFIKIALAQTERQFFKGKIYDLAKVVVGDGIVTSKGAKWKKNRQQINPIFAPKNLMTFDSTIQEAIASTIESQKASLDQTINLSQVCSHLTFTIIARTMFSISDEQEFSPLAKNFKECLDYLSWYFWTPFAIPLKIPTPRNKRFVNARSYIISYISQLIDNRNPEDKKDDLLQRLMDAQSEDSRRKLTRGEIIDETLTAMLAGYETTALTLSYSFFLLAENPSYIGRIREQVHQVCGNQPISSDHVKQLTLVSSVIKETMRLYPSAYMINRTNRDTVKYINYTFRPNTTFFFPQYAVHRHEAHWDKPLEFRPERFLDGKNFGPSYFPFGGGPRTCVGNHLALLEACLCLGEIIRNLDVAKVVQTFKLLPSATMMPSPDLKIRFRSPS